MWRKLGNIPKQQCFPQPNQVVFLPKPNQTAIVVEGPLPMLPLSCYGHVAVVLRDADN